MKKLPLSKEVHIPVDVCTEAVAWVGARGSGKTHGAGKLVELLVGAGVPIIWLDPVGVAYGLRLAKDGKGRGLPIPVFGCLGCISKDRESFAAKEYAKWKKEYRLPKCPSCGKKMLHYGYNFDSKQVRAEVICSSHDADGVPTCEDEDVTVVIA